MERNEVAIVRDSNKRTLQMEPSSSFNVDVISEVSSAQEETKRISIIR